MPVVVIWAKLVIVIAAMAAASSVSRDSVFTFIVSSKNNLVASGLNQFGQEVMVRRDE
jgi:hypothetical protein